MERSAPNMSVPYSFMEASNVLNLLSLKFKDASLESTYRQEGTAKVIFKSRVAVALSFFLYIAYTIIVFFTEPAATLSLWLIRGFVAALYLLVYASTYSKYIKIYPQTFVMAGSFVVVCVVFFAIFTGYSEKDQYCYAGVNLCITWIIFMIGLRFINSLIVVGVILVAYNFTIYFFGIGMLEIISNNFFLVSNVLICVFAGYTLEKSSRWKFYQTIIIKNNSSALHRAVIQATTDAVISIDEAGCILEFNQSAEKMFGLSAKDAVGRSMDDIVLLQKSRGVFEFFSHNKNLMAPGSRHEFYAARKDGSYFPVEITLNEITLIGRQLMIAHIRDLTAQHNAKEEISRQREILQRNERLSALGSLLAGVAHELNNPLSVVVGQSQLLKETEKDKRVLNRAEKISHAAMRCAKVVSTFLSMARQQPSQRTNVNLSEIIRDAVKLLEDNLKINDVNIDLQLQENLPCIFANGDQLHQVVSNMIINAQQAMKSSLNRHLIVRTQFCMTKAMVIVDFIDTGPGVPIAIRNRIFEPFFTTKSVGMGSGIGLSVCNGIVEAHGGYIQLTDSAGSGACFTISLPSSQFEEIAEIQQDISASKNNTKQNVLVVDDELEIRELVSEILRNAGHEVRCANNGLDALESLHHSLPDIIFSDLSMPIMSGAELFYKAVNFWPECGEKFVFMTGDLLTTDNINFLRTVNLRVLEKPFVPDKLMAMLS